MRSFAARHSADKRALVLMAPGWVRTEMGGPEGLLSVEESIPNLVSALLAAKGHAGLQYLDYLGRTVPVAASALPTRMETCVCEAFHTESGQQKILVLQELVEQGSQTNEAREC